ncbi:MAG TPA: hypothetical protein VLR26_03965 [Frankiaceae bacterium]|nr:hypothetical protein [Frankiaceae bacterium]
MATSIPSPSLLAAAGLVGGFAAARYTKRRELGGAVFAVAGAVSGREWARQAGPVPAAVLGAVYTLAMGGSHPLAKQVGPWPSVLLVTAATVVASEVVLRRSR